MYHIDLTVTHLPYVTFHCTVSEVSRMHRFNVLLISSNRFASSKFSLLQGGVFERRCLWLFTPGWFPSTWSSLRSRTTNTAWDAFVWLWCSSEWLYTSLFSYHSEDNLEKLNASSSTRIRSRPLKFDFADRATSPLVPPSERIYILCRALPYWR